MGKVFFLNRAYVDFVPRHSKLNNSKMYSWKEMFWHSGWIFCILFVFPCILIGIWLGYGQFILREIDFRNHGISTTATVVDCRREVSGTGRTQTIAMYLTYRYVANNSELTITEVIPRPATLCENVPPQIAVEYLVYSPSTVRVNDVSVDTNQIWYIHIALLIPIIFYFFAIIFLGLQIFPMIIFERWQIPLLEREGVMLDGEILSCTGKMTKSKDYLVTITYQFTIQKQTKRGNFSSTRYDLIGKPLPPVGTPIKVLYVNRFCYIPL